MEGPKARLHIIVVGELDPDAVAALRERFEMSVITVDPVVGREFRWSRLADSINREMDELSGWVLLLRAGEKVDATLAESIGRAVSDKPVAWAYRIGSSPQYCDGPLFRKGRRTEGEIRLFHSRRCRFLPRGESRELQARGTVIRIRDPILETVYGSEDEHRQNVAGDPERSPGGRVLTFLASLWRDRYRLTYRAVRFHWIEAGRERR